MQRRVFQIGGEPFLATRADGFYETVGTLMRMVEDHLRDHAPEPIRESLQAPLVRANEDLPVPIPVAATSEAPTAVRSLLRPMEELPVEQTAMEDGLPIAASLNEVVHPAPVKRGRGRPRKHPRALQDGSQEAALAESASIIDPASAGSGRPSGSPAPNYSKAASSGPPSSPHTSPRRGPGRPRKNPASPEVVIVADDPPWIAEAAIADDSPDSMATVAVRADDLLRAPRIRGLKVPRWQIAGKLRRGRLK